ncbi:MAG: tetratricopeptide repeat protein [Thermoguttaceae bacterium]|nr:tetratricopeptide repeat protein [Thermoguttaceae bacterium]MBQ1862999.1 tetratricopeptide repeat protein [Thermoguttaceae bacterium]MBQ2040012.1 tetratricopeptide repeat protein [Thermoguttaceae bacterium]MBQ2556754.1 tetratricopeptide repeat protein [Thermoguttaceae bacterium]MBQ3822774.1 tetratricopeptide repeat protein [Thermoguttaceae bacterium]
MSLSWKRLSIYFAVSAVAAAASISLSFADEPEPVLPEAPAAESTEKAEPPALPEPEVEQPKLEVDEDDPKEEGSLDEELEKVVEKELGETTKENSAEELINLATELKLSATTLLDLTKVVSLLNKAEKMGLDDENKEFAHQLKVSARLDRGLAVAQLFMSPELNLDELPRGWQALRNNAIGDLEYALKENPDMPIANLSLGRLYMIAEREADAKKTLDLAISSEDEYAEDSVKVLALMFRALLENDPRAAIPFVEKAIGIEPEAEPRLYSQYSAYLQLTGRTDEALKQIDRAIELAPDVPDYKKEKAILLAKIKRIDEARKLFDEATAGAESNVALMVEKGQFLASIDDYDAALALYTDLLAKYDGPGLYFLRGALYAQQKNFRQALADANQALRRDANLLPALRLKGVIYLEMERYDDAVRTFTQLRDKSKDDAGKLEAKTQIAYALSKQGKYRTASELLKKELEKQPDNVELLRSLADMELLFGHWGEADRLYKRLLEIDPKDSGVLNNYSWLLATCPEDQYRDAARALEYGKQAAEATLYAAPHILSTLAAAYAEGGDFESARSWSQKAVELGEKENHESLDSLKKELESYKENKPWRETSEVLEVTDGDAPAPPAEENAAEVKPEETEQNAE